MGGMPKAVRRRHTGRAASEPGHPLTSHVSPPLRQGVARLVRDALSLAKKLANPIGASQLCICHDNLTRAAA